MSSSEELMSDGAAPRTSYSAPTASPSFDAMFWDEQVNPFARQKPYTISADVQNTEPAAVPAWEDELEEVIEADDPTEWPEF